MFTLTVYRDAIYLCYISFEVFNGTDMRELSVEVCVDFRLTSSCVLQDCLLAVSQYHMTMHRHGEAKSQRWLKIVLSTVVRTLTQSCTTEVCIMS